MAGNDAVLSFKVTGFTETASEARRLMGDLKSLLSSASMSAPDFKMPAGLFSGGSEGLSYSADTFTEAIPTLSALGGASVYAQTAGGAVNPSNPQAVAAAQQAVVGSILKDLRDNLKGNSGKLTDDQQAFLKKAQTDILKGVQTSYNQADLLGSKMKDSLAGTGTVAEDSARKIARAAASLAMLTQAAQAVSTSRSIQPPPLLRDVERSVGLPDSSGSFWSKSISNLTAGFRREMDQFLSAAKQSANSRLAVMANEEQERLRQQVVKTGPYVGDTITYSPPGPKSSPVSAQVLSVAKPTSANTAGRVEIRRDVEGARPEVLAYQEYLKRLSSGTITPISLVERAAEPRQVRVKASTAERVVGRDRDDPLFRSSLETKSAALGSWADAALRNQSSANRAFSLLRAHFDDMSAMVAGGGVGEILTDARQFRKSVPKKAQARQGLLTALQEEGYSPDDVRNAAGLIEVLQKLPSRPTFSDRGLPQGMSVTSALTKYVKGVEGKFGTGQLQTGAGLEKRLLAQKAANGTYSLAEAIFQQGRLGEPLEIMPPIAEGLKSPTAVAKRAGEVLRERAIAEIRSAIQVADPVPPAATRRVRSADEAAGDSARREKLLAEAEAARIRLESSSFKFTAATLQDEALAAKEIQQRTIRKFEKAGTAESPEARAAIAEQQRSVDVLQTRARLAADPGLAQQLGRTRNFIDWEKITAETFEEGVGQLQQQVLAMRNAPIPGGNYKDPGAGATSQQKQQAAQAAAFTFRRRKLEEFIGNSLKQAKVGDDGMPLTPDEVGANVARILPDLPAIAGRALLEPNPVTKRTLTPRQYLKQVEEQVRASVAAEAKQWRKANPGKPTPDRFSEVAIQERVFGSFGRTAADSVAPAGTFTDLEKAFLEPERIKSGLLQSPPPGFELRKSGNEFEIVPTGVGGTGQTLKYPNREAAERALRGLQGKPQVETFRAVKRQMMKDLQEEVASRMLSTDALKKQGLFQELFKIVKTGKIEGSDKSRFELRGPVLDDGSKLSALDAERGYTVYSKGKGVAAPDEMRATADFYNQLRSQPLEYSGVVAEYRSRVGNLASAARLTTPFGRVGGFTKSRGALGLFDTLQRVIPKRERDRIEAEKMELGGDSRVSSNARQRAFGLDAGLPLQDVAEALESQVRDQARREAREIALRRAREFSDLGGFDADPILQGLDSSKPPTLAAFQKDFGYKFGKRDGKWTVLDSAGELAFTQPRAIRDTQTQADIDAGRLSAEIPRGFASKTAARDAFWMERRDRLASSRRRVLEEQWANERLSLWDEIPGVDRGELTDRPFSILRSTAAQREALKAEGLGDLPYVTRTPFRGSTQYGTNVGGFQFFGGEDEAWAFEASRRLADSRKNPFVDSDVVGSILRGEPLTGTPQAIVSSATKLAEPYKVSKKGDEYRVIRNRRAQGAFTTEQGAQGYIYQRIAEEINDEMLQATIAQLQKDAAGAATKPASLIQNLFGRRNNSDVRKATGQLKGILGAMTAGKKPTGDLAILAESVLRTSTDPDIRTLADEIEQGIFVPTDRLDGGGSRSVTTGKKKGGTFRPGGGAVRRAGGAPVSDELGELLLADAFGLPSEVRSGSGRYQKPLDALRYLPQPQYESLVEGLRSPDFFGSDLHRDMTRKLQSVYTGKYNPDDIVRKALKPEDMDALLRQMQTSLLEGPAERVTTRPTGFGPGQQKFSSEGRWYVADTQILKPDEALAKVESIMSSYKGKGYLGAQAPQDFVGLSGGKILVNATEELMSDPSFLSKIASQEDGLRFLSRNEGLGKFGRISGVAPGTTSMVNASALAGFTGEEMSVFAQAEGVGLRTSRTTGPLAFLEGLRGSDSYRAARQDIYKGLVSEVSPEETQAMEMRRASLLDQLVSLGATESELAGIRNAGPHQLEGFVRDYQEKASKTQAQLSSFDRTPTKATGTKLENLLRKRVNGRPTYSGGISPYLGVEEVEGGGYRLRVGGQGFGGSPMKGEVPGGSSLPIFDMDQTLVAAREAQAARKPFPGIKAAAEGFDLDKVYKDRGELREGAEAATAIQRRNVETWQRVLDVYGGTSVADSLAQTVALQSELKGYSAPAGTIASQLVGGRLGSLATGKVAGLPGIGSIQELLAPQIGQIVGDFEYFKASSVAAGREYRGINPTGAGGAIPRNPDEVANEIRRAIYKKASGIAFDPSELEGDGALQKQLRSLAGSGDLPKDLSIRGASPFLLDLFKNLRAGPGLSPGAKLGILAVHQFDQALKSKGTASAAEERLALEGRMLQEVNPADIQSELSQAWKPGDRRAEFGKRLGISTLYDVGGRTDRYFEDFQQAFQGNELKATQMVMGDVRAKAVEDARAVRGRLSAKETAEFGAYGSQIAGERVGTLFSRVSGGSFGQIGAATTEAERTYAQAFVKAAGLVIKGAEKVGAASTEAASEIQALDLSKINDYLSKAGGGAASAIEFAPDGTVIPSSVTSEQKQRALANIAESRRAREASGYRGFPETAAGGGGNQPPKPPRTVLGPADEPDPEFQWLRTLAKQGDAGKDLLRELAAKDADTKYRSFADPDKVDIQAVFEKMRDKFATSVQSSGIPLSAQKSLIQEYNTAVQGQLTALRAGNAPDVMSYNERTRIAQQLASGATPVYSRGTSTAGRAAVASPSVGIGIGDDKLLESMQRRVQQTRSVLGENVIGDPFQLDNIPDAFKALTTAQPMLRAARAKILSESPAAALAEAQRRLAEGEFKFQVERNIVTDPDMAQQRELARMRRLLLQSQGKLLDSGVPLNDPRVRSITEQLDSVDDLDMLRSFSQEARGTVRQAKAAERIQMAPESAALRRQVRVAERDALVDTSTGRLTSEGRSAAQESARAKMADEIMRMQINKEYEAGMQAAGYPVGGGGGGGGGGHRGRGLRGMAGGPEGFLAAMAPSQLLQQGLSMASWMLPMNMLYGTIHAIKENIQALEDMERAFAKAGVQFEMLYGSESIDKLATFKGQVLELARTTGLSPMELTEQGRSIYAAFGRPETELATSVVKGGPTISGSKAGEAYFEDVTKISKVTGLELSLAKDTVQTMSLAWGIDAGTAGDLAVQTASVYGVNAGETLKGVSDAATIGAQAGFSPEQMFSLIAEVDRRAGARTAAGVSESINRALVEVPKQYKQLLDLRQMIPELRTAEFDEGLATGNVVKVLTAIGRLTGGSVDGGENLSRLEKDQILGAVGQQRNAKDFFPLVAALPDVIDESTPEARKLAQGHAGQLDKSFERVMASLGGQMDQLRGSIRGIFLAVVGSGIGDAFVTILGGVTKVLGAVSSLGGLFIKLDEKTSGWLKRGIAGMAQWVIMLRTIVGLADHFAASTAAGGGVSKFAQLLGGTPGRTGTAYGRGANYIKGVNEALSGVYSSPRSSRIRGAAARLVGGAGIAGAAADSVDDLASLGAAGAAGAVGTSQSGLRGVVDRVKKARESRRFATMLPEGHLALSAAPLVEGLLDDDIFGDDGRSGTVMPGAPNRRARFNAWRTRRKSFRRLPWGHQALTAEPLAVLDDLPPLPPGAAAKPAPAGFFGSTIGMAKAHPVLAAVTAGVVMAKTLSDYADKLKESEQKDLSELRKMNVDQIKNYKGENGFWQAIHGFFGKDDIQTIRARGLAYKTSEGDRDALRDSIEMVGEDEILKAAGFKPPEGVALGTNEDPENRAWWKGVAQFLSFGTARVGDTVAPLPSTLLDPGAKEYSKIKAQESAIEDEVRALYKKTGADVDDNDIMGEVSKYYTMALSGDIAGVQRAAAESSDVGAIATLKVIQDEAENDPALKQMLANLKVEQQQKAEFSKFMQSSGLPLEELMGNYQLGKASGGEVVASLEANIHDLDLLIKAAEEEGGRNDQIIKYKQQLEMQKQQLYTQMVQRQQSLIVGLKGLQGGNTLDKLDAQMAANLAIVNDPNVSPEARQQALQGMIQTQQQRYQAWIEGGPQVGIDPRRKNPHEKRARILSPPDFKPDEKSALLAGLSESIISDDTGKTWDDFLGAYEDVKVGGAKDMLKDLLTSYAEGKITVANVNAMIKEMQAQAYDLMVEETEKALGELPLASAGKVRQVGAVPLGGDKKPVRTGLPAAKPSRGGTPALKLVDGPAGPDTKTQVDGVWYEWSGSKWVPIYGAGIGGSNTNQPRASAGQGSYHLPNTDLDKKGAPDSSKFDMMSSTLARSKKSGEFYEKQSDGKWWNVLKTSELPESEQERARLQEELAKYRGMAAAARAAGQDTSTIDAVIAETTKSIQGLGIDKGALLQNDADIDEYDRAVKDLTGRVRNKLKLQLKTAGKFKSIATMDQEIALVMADIAHYREEANRQRGFGNTKEAEEFENQAIQSQIEQATKAREQRDYMRETLKSKNSILAATLNYHGDLVGVAQNGLADAQRILNDMLSSGDFDPDGPQVASQRAELINQMSNTREAMYKKQLSDIDFGLTMESMTKGQAVAQLKAMRAIYIDNIQMTREIDLKIRELEKSADLAWGLPDRIKLPTLYEVRRLNQIDQPAGGSSIGYQDNRNVNVVVYVTNGMSQGQIVETLSQAGLGDNRSSSLPRRF